MLGIVRCSFSCSFVNKIKQKLKRESFENCGMLGDPSEVHIIGVIAVSLTVTGLGTVSSDRVNFAISALFQPFRACISGMTVMTVMTVVFQETFWGRCTCVYSSPPQMNHLTHNFSQKVQSLQSIQSESSILIHFPRFT
jgi:hypothetical protein